MTSQSLSSSVRASPRIGALALPWLFTVCAIFAPMLLIAYAYATSPDAMERAQLVVQGLESIVFALFATLSLWAYLALAVKSDPVRLIGESTSLSGTTSA